MSTFDQLYKASFKSARFLPIGEMSTAGGRKKIDHLYPNSERRYIEDLGKMQRDFTIRGQVQGPNYFAKVRRLLGALESEGAGILVHPFFGTIEVEAKPYTLIEDMAGIGVATFEMSFSVPSPNIYPTSAGLFRIPSFVNDVVNKVRTLLATDWTQDFADALLTAEDTLNSVYDVFDDITRKIAGVQDNISAFNRIVSDAQNNIAAVVRDPSLIFDSFNNAFIALNSFSTSSEDTINLLKNNIFGMEVGDSTKASTTELRAAEIQNNRAINQSMNTLALTYAYQNANLVDFGNDQDLISFSEFLEEQFLNIIDDLDQSTADSLYILRDEYRKYSENLLVTIDRVITVNVNKIPITVLAYQYYGSTEKYNDIMTLNKTLNPTEVSGDVKILTA